MKAFKRWILKEEEEEMNQSHFSLRIVAALLVLAGFTLLGIGTAQPQDRAAAKSEVTIDNFSFSPGTVTVSVGATVRWTNHDDVPHTVVSEDKSFKSKALDTDDQFTYTFTKAGTYSYFCSLHPKMTAKVVVQ
jgi:plastocyanin